MTPEKRFLLAMSLSLLFLMIWGQVMVKKRQEALKKRQEQQQQVQNNNNAQNNDAQNKDNAQKKEQNNNENNNNENNNEDENNNENNENENNEDENNEDERQNVADEKFVVETPKYYMVWTNKGGSLVSLKLKEYVTGDTDKTKEGWQNNQENWLNIIPEFNAQHLSLTFANNTGDKEKLGASSLSNSLWNVINETDKKPQRLIFTKTDNGVLYKKIFTFTEKNVIKGEVVITNTRDQNVTCNPAIGGSSGISWECADKTVGQFITLHHFYRNHKGNPVSSYEYLDTAIADNFTMQNNFSWLSIDNKYFSTVIEAVNPQEVSGIASQGFSPDAFYIQKNISAKRAKGEKPNEKDLEAIKLFTPILQFASFDLAKGESKTLQFNFRASSKVDLAKDNKDFTILEDFGMFDFVARFLLAVATLFAGIFGNYGIAIICMTVCIKLILFPLTKKQQLSMQKYQKSMKVIQPQLKKLQQKYKNNRQKLNQEMMALYKKHNVNPIPVGGCLPIFVQIPIFIGLYQSLQYSILLRQETFLWVTDLAQPDRFMLVDWSLFNSVFGDYLNILPIIMTVLWILQQKLMPRPESPEMQQQQKIFMFMTIFFGFLFYSLPSGLVMYWLTVNLISIGEQLIIRKLKEKQE